MSQNNMITYITLNDLDAEKIEVNPAFIVMMRRDTYEPEEGVEMPFTKIYLSTNQHIYALETPEEVVKHMNVIQARELYDYLKKVFGG